jgi:hypothetical protein
MAVESDDQRDGFVLLGIGCGLADDLLVAQVNAIEKANRQADFAPGGLQFTKLMNEFHCVGSNHACFIRC